MLLVSTPRFYVPIDAVRKIPAVVFFTYERGRLARINLLAPYTPKG